MPHRPPTRFDIGREVEFTDDGENWERGKLLAIRHLDGGTLMQVEGFYANYQESFVRVPYTTSDPQAELSAAADWLSERGCDEAARILLNTVEILSHNETEMRRLAEQYWRNGMIPRLFTNPPEPQP